MLIIGFFIPAGLVLLAQWMVGYLMAPGENVLILIRPFEVESAFSDDLILKFGLSILFPLVVGMINFRDVIGKTDIQLAWISFFVGAAQMYLLAEGGDRFYHGNFRWSAQVTLFLVFVVTARYVAIRIDLKKSFLNIKSSVVYGVFFTHLLAGIIYYIRVFISPNYG